MTKTSSVREAREPNGAKPWIRPELRRLAAGAAETAGAVSDDGVVGNS